MGEGIGLVSYGSEWKPIKKTVVFQKKKYGEFII
jgi:hypothetical protein